MIFNFKILNNFKRKIIIRKKVGGKIDLLIFLKKNIN